MLRVALLTGLLALPLTGCVISLQSLFTEDTKVFDPALLGTWEAPEEGVVLTFQQSGRKSYRLAVVDSEGERGWFAAHLVNLGGRLFLDTYPLEPQVETVYQFHVVPTHHIIRVRLNEKSLHLAGLNEAWLKTDVRKEEPSELAYVLLEDLIVLTGSPQELQQFLATRARDEEAFQEPTILARAESPRTMTGHRYQVDAVAFSPGGDLLASGETGRVKLWNIATGKEERSLDVDGAALAFSPHGRLLACGSYHTNTIKVLETGTGTIIHALTGHSDGVNDLAYSPGGRWLASGSADNTVRLWDAETGQWVRTLEGHLDRVTSVAFSPDGRMLASGSWDNTIRLWDVNSGREKQTLIHSEVVGEEADSHVVGVLAVAFSPDGQWLASGSKDGTVKLWDPGTGKLRRKLVAADSINDVAFSPNDLRVATASPDGFVRLWDVATGELAWKRVAHLNEVTSVAFSPDGRWLASGGLDQTVKLWEMSGN